MGAGSFATARRVTVDSYTLNKAAEILKRSPGAYQSASLITGVPVGRLREMHPAASRPSIAVPLFRVVGNPAVMTVLELVSDHTGVSEASIMEKDRRRHIARARHIAMWLIRETTGLSMPVIGRRLGGLDHTTVLNGVCKVEQLMREDTVQRTKLLALKERAIRFAKDKAVAA